MPDKEPTVKSSKYSSFWPSDLGPTLPDLSGLVKVPDLSGLVKVPDLSLLQTVVDAASRIARAHKRPAVQCRIWVETSS